MVGQQQGRGTLALLAVIAAAIVVALAAGLGFDPRNVLTPPPETGRGAQPQPSGEAASPRPPAPAAPQTAEAPKPDSAPAGATTAPPPQPATGQPGGGSDPSGQPAGPAQQQVAGNAAPAGAPEPPAPSFDVVRVEPNGESVIAGRSVPGATIEMLRDGQVHSRAAADQSGLFALVPPALPPGSHQLSLQAIAPDGTRQRSKEAVTVVVSEDRSTRPLVALAAPDKPTVLLSNPGAPEPRTAPAPGAGRAQQQAAIDPAAPAAPAGQPHPPQPQAAAPGPAPQRAEVKIMAVEAEDAGRLYVSGKAAPGATVRLYLNETFIAPGGVGPDGTVSFAIGRGVRPGDYRVRIDDVDPVSGNVKSRAEVAFNVPAPPAQAPVPGQVGPQVAAAPPVGAPAQPGTPQALAPVPPPAGTAPPSAARPGAPVPAPDTAARPPGMGSGPGRAPASPGGAPASPSGTAGPGGAAPPSPDSGGGQRSVASADPALRAPPVPDGSLPRSAAPASETGAPSSRANGSQVASASQPDLRDLPPGTVVIPDISTAIVSRGDNLWRISQRIYGRGVRYTVIYGANQGQIRNPNLIYPGQVFVLPNGEETKAP